MRTIFILLFLLLTYKACVAQVGVGTTNPQEQLHVGGTNDATIRLDGLNQTNNVNNSGANQNHLYVDNDGTVQVKDDTPNVAINLESSAFLNNVVVTSTTGALTCQTVRSGNFTLNKDTNVGIFMNSLVGGITTAAGTAITDGAPRILMMRLFIDGTEVLRDSVMYTNLATSGSIPTGLLKLSTAKYKQLTSGNHTYNVDVCVFGSSHSVRAFFGANATINQETSLQIIY